MSTKKDELYRTACRRITKLESKIETTRADADRLAEVIQRIAVQWIGDEIDKEQTGDEPDYQSAYEDVVGIA